MTFNQITSTRLRELDTAWGAALNVSRGPAPRSLGLCHMLAETNGTTPTTTQSTTHRDVGIMRLSLRDTTKLGYQETAAQNANTNIYLWCKLANLHAEALHAAFPTWWTIANLDFWLAVRLVFVMGIIPTKKLLATVNQANSADHSTAAVISWMRSTASVNQCFGTFNHFDLVHLADHLDEVLRGMGWIDGPHYVAPHFSVRVPAPNNEEALFVNTQEYVSHLESGA